MKMLLEIGRPERRWVGRPILDPLGGKDVLLTDSRHMRDRFPFVWAPATAQAHTKPRLDRFEAYDPEA